MKIICDDKIPFLRGVFEPYAEVVYLPGAEICASDVRDADALIVRTRTRCDAALLQGSSVRVIASATIGYDHIDTAWCSGHGIEWANAPGCNAGSVAQYVESALLTLSRLHGLDLGAQTLGIVGVGHVGSKVEQLARRLGMRVLLCDPPRAAAARLTVGTVSPAFSPAPAGDDSLAVPVSSTDQTSPAFFPTPASVTPHAAEDFCSLDDLVAGSDIITLHVPLDDSTRYMFDATQLASMRPDQILINTSRGEVVNCSALRDLLARCHAAGISPSDHTPGGPGVAVLDVWENEPNIDRELLRLVDIGTPHIAGYSADGKANGTTAAVRFVARRLGISPLRDWSVSPDSIPPATYPGYDVTRDSDALKSTPDNFEFFREHYPIRREYY